MSDYRDVVVSSGTAFNAMDGDGCFDFIVGGTLNLSGGIASGTTVLPRGVENVFSGGLSVGAVLSGMIDDEYYSDSRGEQRVYSGGEVREITVLSGGLLDGSGGMVNTVSIEDGGQVCMVGGAISAATVGGWLNAMAPAFDTKIVSGGIAKFGSTNYDTEVLSGGSAMVDSSSYNENYDIFAATWNMVAHSGSKLNLGCVMLAGSGTNIASGCLDFSPGSYSYSNEPHVSGGQVVNGVADGLNVTGFFAFGSGIEAHKTIAGTLADLRLYDGAVSYDTILDGATMFVMSGATAVHTAVGTIKTLLNSKMIIHGGTVSNCLVGVYGELAIKSGICDGAIVSSGSFISWNDSGCTVRNLTLASGSYLMIGKNYLYMDKDAFVGEFLSSNSFGGVVSGFNFFASDNTLVSGGSGVDLKILRNLTVASGAEVKNTVIGEMGGNNCKLRIESGAYSEGSHVLGFFCSEDVYGVSVGARITATQNIFSGGISSAAVVDSGGRINVSSGGMLIDAVCEIGSLRLASGAIISGATRLHGMSIGYSMVVNAPVKNYGELIFDLNLSEYYGFNDTKVFVSNLDLIEGGTFRIDPGDTPPSHVYILADKAVNVPELKITIGGVDRVFAPGETIKFGDKTMVMTNDAETGLRLEVSLRTEKLYGMLNSAGDYVLNEQNAVIRSLVMVGAGSTAGNTNGKLRIAADTNANIFGGASNADIGGNVSLKIGGRPDVVYRGLIFGGSRVYGAGASATIGSGVNMQLSDVIHQDNKKLIAAGKGASAWIVIGGQAVAGAALTVNGISQAAIYESSNLERVCGGAQASGAGSVAECQSSFIHIQNSVVRGDIYGGGYADNGGLSIVSKATNVTIDASSDSAVTVQGNIYGGGANPRHDTTGGSSIVKGDSLIVFSGKGESITVGMVSGDGRVAGTVLGTRRLEFHSFTGEFSGMLKNFDVVNFSGVTKSMTCATYYESSCFEFSLFGRRPDSELFLADGMGFAEGDKLLKVDVQRGNDAGTYELMAVDDTTDLSTLMVEVYNGNQLLASFDYGGSSQGFSVEKKEGILSFTVAEV